MEKRIVTKCAWCKMVYNQTTKKWEMNPALDHDDTVIFSHGMCPTCKKSYFLEIKEGAK